MCRAKDKRPNQNMDNYSPDHPRSMLFLVIGQAAAAPAAVTVAVAAAVAAQNLPVACLHACKQTGRRPWSMRPSKNSTCSVGPM